MTLRRFLLALTATLVIILAIVIWFFPSDEDFRTENPFWNGAKDVSSNLSFTPLESLSDLPSSPQGTTLVLIPYIEFTASELRTVNDFVIGGGTLIVADDYGFGNQVVEYLGLAARFSGEVLADPLFNYKNQRLPRVFHLVSASLTAGARSLVLNHATSLTDVTEEEVLALSSSFSFLDINNDGSRDSDEPTGPLPVLSEHSLAGGRVILMADPSILINSMDAMDDNDALIRNIAGTSPRVLLDQSHLPQSDLHETKDVLAAVRSSLATPVGTLALVAVLLVLTLRPIWYRKGGEIG